MLVPEFWAESSAKHRTRNRQITVRRFGWSDIGPDHAKAMADSRVRDALDRLVVGEALPRREPKVPYNGAEGVPIREEIVLRAGPDIVTRNSYGALCLNTPDVLFVDIDQPSGPPFRIFASYFGVLLALSIAWISTYGRSPIVVGIFVFMLLSGVWICNRLFRLWVMFQGGEVRIVRSRVERFVNRHPDWHLRLYRTPAGFRVIAMHQTFAPGDPEVAECFDSLRVDPQFARMCLRQNCFRARISPKPWRIGMQTHIKPRRGVWPISPELKPERDSWVAKYEQKARDFAACRFLESLGSLRTTARTTAVMRMHDDRSLALTELPLA